MLQGVRVIELGTTITAPLTAMLLADLGADVIKVERPEGDPFRSFRGTRAGNPYFETFNRGKRSVVLDLAQAEGQAKMRSLLHDADVFVDNVRPSVLPRIGLDPEALRGANPRLIHCSITGFGATGPYSTRPAFDTVAQALSGLASMSLDPAAPVITGPTISDSVTGMYACIAILGALTQRGAGGTGARLEVNMVEATMALVGEHFTALQAGIVPNRRTRGAGSQSYAFACADERLIAIHLSSLEKFWTGIVAATEAPELAADPRFATGAGRIANYVELQAELAGRFATKDRAAWIERLASADVPFAPVNSFEEALDDPHIRALGIAERPETSGTHTGAVIKSPILLDGRRPTAIRPAPLLGEHTAEVCEAAGASP
jgi:crotonobetainyl-CoA:carnitine CoA-transferase CaiB-like acyl-CoA transferase